jgi:hypothetical protein
VAIGAKVIITDNVDMDRGASNGSTATVLKLGYRLGKLNKITVKLDGNGHEVIMRSRGLVDGSFSIGSSNFSKLTFSLSLGYAMTGHSCQGATIAKHVVIYSCEGFCPGLLYVMLSRVTESRFVRIALPLKPSDFRSVRIPGLSSAVAQNEPL